MIIPDTLYTWPREAMVIKRTSIEIQCFNFIISLNRRGKICNSPAAIAGQSYNFIIFNKRGRNELIATERKRIKRRRLNSILLLKD
jgi:hypothetical protein